VKAHVSGIDRAMDNGTRSPVARRVAISRRR
jgi:hypothetical protein